MPLHNKNTRMFTITCLIMHPKCTTVKSNTTDSTSFELFTCELLFHSLRKICCYFFVFLVNVALSLSIYLSQCVCVCRIFKLIEINLPLILLRFFFLSFLTNCTSKKYTINILFLERLNCMQYTQNHMKTDVDRYIIDCCHPTN